MKFEGTQVNIPIKGIMRAGTDNLCADGAMNEVIGMEYKDGSWLPYLLKNKTLVIGDGTIQVDKAWVHKISTNKEIKIFLSGKHLYYETSFEHGVSSVSEIASNIKDINFIGDVICALTEDGIDCYRWQEGTYVKYNIGCPNVRLRASDGFINKGEKIYGVYFREKNTVQTGREKYMGSGVISALGALSEKGGISGYAFARVAYRLKNGELVFASAPYLVCKPRMKDGTYAEGYKYVKADGETYDFSNTSTPLVFYSQGENGEAPSPYVAGDKRALTVYVLDRFSLAANAFEYGINDASRDGVYEVRKNNSFFEIGTGDYTSQIVGLFNNNIYYPYIPDILSTEVKNISDGYYQNYYHSFASGCGLQYYIEENIDIQNNIIDSICIFMTQEVSPYEIRENEEESAEMFHPFVNVDRRGYYPTLFVDPATGNWTKVSCDYRINSAYVKRKPEEKIIKELSELNTFYLVDEKPLNNINSGVWNDVDLNGKLGSNLVVRPQLPLTSSDRNESLYYNIDSRNFRLHAYDYIQKLFSGYSYDELIHNGGIGQYDTTTKDEGLYKWEIKVELQDEYGNSTVVNYDGEGTEEIVSSLCPVLSYPSTYAKRMTISIYEMHTGEGATQNCIYERVFELTPLSNLGVAAYFEPELKPIEIIEGEYKKKNERDEYVVPTTFVPSEPYNITRFFHNGLKVSDVAYPMYFPTNFTYRIGNEQIIGLASLTQPVSQDNFSVFQLAVFCTDGIYMMKVDETGQGAYTNIPPKFSPEVCINRNTICEIGGAILFASDKGLMIMTSDGVDEFVPHLNGRVRFEPSNAGEIKSAESLYNKLVSTPSITNILSAISGDQNDELDFMTYLQDSNTVVSYVSKKNKVVVYNKTHEYCYLIDIKSRNVTKLATRIDFDDNNNPEETFYSKDSASNVYVYTTKTFKYNSEYGKADCLIQSRPIKIQQDDKSSYRVVITGYFEGNEGKWAELLVFGSLDGDHWHAIGIKEKRLYGGFHNIGCVTSHSSWKYLMFIFAGSLSDKSHIDSIDITATGRYNNKKR